MQDNAERARDLLAARREHSKGQGNFPTPEPHMGLRDERPEDREPRDLPKAKDDLTARTSHRSSLGGPSTSSCSRGT